MEISEFQRVITETYGARDEARGLAAAVAWLAEEVGELAKALRKGTAEEQAEEFADTLAWLATLAALSGIDLGAVAERRYGTGCPKCAAQPCACPTTTRL